MEKEYPKRKKNRWTGYDYSTNGAYFITLCTNKRKQTLSHVVSSPDENSSIVGAIHESPELTPKGKIVENILKNLPPHLNSIIEQYVIMPNHIHMVVFVCNEERAIRESPLQGRSVISKVVGYIKMNASKKIHKEFGTEQVFQRSYYDHVIRNRDEYEKISKYIYENPANWQKDDLYVE